MRERGGVIALLVMLVADVILVGWALGLFSMGSGDDPPPGTTSTSNPTTTSASSRPSPSAEEPPEAGVPLLEAADADHAWRATFVPCETGAGEASVEVERTVDGGQTWQSSEIEAQSVLRLRMTSTTDGFAVIADEDCEPAVVSTTDGGKTWGAAAPAGLTWGLWPEGGGDVLVPGGVRAEACIRGDVVSLSAVDGEQAYVLCDDGAVRETRDRGGSWSVAAKVSGAIALSVRDGHAVVGVEEQECDGIELRAGQIADQLVFGQGEVCVADLRRPVAVAALYRGGWVADHRMTRGFSQLAG